jgi:hypothetical protein
LDALSRKDDTKDQRRKRVLSVYSVAAKGAVKQEMKAAVGFVRSDDDDDDGNDDGAEYEEAEEDGVESDDRGVRFEDSARLRGRDGGGGGGGAEEEEEEVETGEVTSPSGGGWRGKRRLTPGPAKRKNRGVRASADEGSDGGEQYGDPDVSGGRGGLGDEGKVAKPKAQPAGRGKPQVVSKVRGTIEPGESDDSISPVVSEDEADDDDDVDT